MFLLGVNRDFVPTRLRRELCHAAAAHGSAYLVAHALTLERVNVPPHAMAAESVDGFAPWAFQHVLAPLWTALFDPTTPIPHCGVLEFSRAIIFELAELLFCGQFLKSIL